MEIFLSLAGQNLEILVDFEWRIGVRFYFFAKKKTHPNSSLKIQKGAFFVEFKRKKNIPEIWFDK